MLAVESVAVADLVFDPANVRKHDKRNLDAIKGSLARFGQQKPIVVGDGNVVIAGNGMLAAAIDLGWKSINVVRSPLKGTEATAYAIADNRTAELAEWDQPALADLLSSLQLDPDFDETATGFSAEEIAEMIGRIESAPLDPSPKLGDLEYRVVVDCADEREQAQLIERLEKDGYSCRALMS